MSSQIHRARIEVEEMRSARTLDVCKDLPYRDAITDPDTRATYIRREYRFLYNFWSLINVECYRLATPPMVDRSFRQRHYTVNKEDAV